MPRLKGVIRLFKLAELHSFSSSPKSFLSFFASFFSSFCEQSAFRKSAAINWFVAVVTKPGRKTTTYTQTYRKNMNEIRVTRIYRKKEKMNKETINSDGHIARALSNNFNRTQSPHKWNRNVWKKSISFNSDHHQLKRQQNWAERSWKHVILGGLFVAVTHKDIASNIEVLYSFNEIFEFFLLLFDKKPSCDQRPMHCMTNAPANVMLQCSIASPQCPMVLMWMYLVLLLFGVQNERFSTPFQCQRIHFYISSPFNVFLHLIRLYDWNETETNLIYWVEKGEKMLLNKRSKRNTEGVRINFN